MRPERVREELRSREDGKRISAALLLFLADGASLRLPLLPAGEKCLLAPLPDTGRRYQPCLALSTVTVFVSKNNSLTICQQVRVGVILRREGCLYGCYVHSSIIPTFHRRCYWLLQ
eukprot:superscaffoldBa00001596_g11238